MKKINIRGLYDRIILHRFNNHVVVMESITDKEVKDIENELKNSKNLSFKLKNGKLITQSEIFLYGKVDIENEQDKELLKSFENRIWDWTEWNHIVYSNIDYETGNVKIDENLQVYKKYSTVDVINWIKYNLLLINNPKNIIIYKIPMHAF